MSTTTFHKIKQLENGDFLVTTKCSNDSAPPHEWTMEYYRTEFPGFNARQREAALILNGIYSGDKYYPAKYKRLQELGYKYAANMYAECEKYPYPFSAPATRERFERELELLKKYGRELPDGAYDDYDTFTHEINLENLEYVNGFISFVDSQPKQKKTNKYREGQAVEMLGEKHGGGHNAKYSGWQYGTIQKLTPKNITLKFDGWQACRMSVEAFEKILSSGTMRIVEQGAAA